MQSNFRHLYADVLWYGVLAGSAMAFLAIYAARLGANSFQISLFTAAPALVNLFISLPAGRWLEHQSIIRATFWSASFQRAGYLSFFFLPRFFNSEAQIWAMVIITLVMSIPGAFLAISFNALFADVVPPDRRGEVVGKRNAIMALSLTAASLTCGLLLDNVQFPLNFQIVFLLGATGAALSTYHLGKLEYVVDQPAPRIGKPLGDLAQSDTSRYPDNVRSAIGLRFLTRAGNRPFLRLDLLRSSFGPFIAVYLAFYIFLYMPIPLFPIAYIQLLDLSNGAISLGNALFYGMMILSSLKLKEISARYGHHKVLTTGALLFGQYPLLLGLARGEGLYWTASLFGGGIYGLVNAGLTNRLMERVPENERPAGMALHNVALNLGILAGSLMGPLLSQWIGLRASLLVSAGLRFLGGILLGIWG